MYRRIMVPLDGSRFAESALPLALAVSRRSGAPLHLVTVQEPMPAFAYEEWESAASGWSRTYLDTVLERVRSLAGAQASATLLVGHVAEALEQEAQAREAGLVIMATHGRGAFSRAWLGSVADAFLHHTRIPLLLVRPEEGDAEPDLNADRSFARILVPLDGTPLAESILAHAAFFAGLFGAVLHLVRVVPFPLQLTLPDLPHATQMDPAFVAEAKEAAAAYLEARAERLWAQGHPAESSVMVAAQPGQSLLEKVAEAGCDLVAMATRGRAGLSRVLLGSTADKVVRGSRTPVLVFRPLD